MKTCLVSYLRGLQLISSETCAEATRSISAELLDERLRLFEYDVAFNGFYRFFDHTLCSVEAHRVEGIIARLAHFGARIETVVTSAAEEEWREKRRQKMYAETFASHLTAATKKSAERVGSFFKARKPDELYFAPAQINVNSVIQQKREISGK